MSTLPPDYIKREWRCEQLVAGGWVVVPHEGLTIVTSINHEPRLMRGDREVGGQWRMFVDEELVYTWTPWRQASNTEEAVT